MDNPSESENIVTERPLTRVAAFILGAHSLVIPFILLFFLRDRVPQQFLEATLDVQVTIVFLFFLLIPSGGLLLLYVAKYGRQPKWLVKLSKL